MTRGMILPLLLGLVGCAVLIGLGLWQVQRLAWKEAMLAEIEARATAAPVPLPGPADPVRDRYLPVRAIGDIGAEYIAVLASQKNIGAGYRVVSPLNTEDGRRVLVDRGFVALEARDAVGPAPAVSVQGNLHWPDETDDWTPAPDLEANIWFARDVAAMAQALDTEPLLIVAADIQPAAPGIVPRPVGTDGIPNDHLGYAITWFGLAAIWAGMTVFLVWRIRQRTD